MGRIEIEPGSVAQVKRALSGRLVLVPDDVCNVVRDLREIDRGLRVEMEEDGSLYVVFHQDGPKQTLVTTAKHLDQRLVQRVREVASERYDYVAELDRLEAKADAAQERRHRDWSGDLAQRLAHAFRKDLGRHRSPGNTVKSRAAGFALKE
jgi:hypothetical protein